MKRVVAPKPRKPEIKCRPIHGAAVNSLDWKDPYDAIEEFLNASTKAAIDLAGFPRADKLLSWLKNDVHSQVDEYIQWLNKCSNDINAASECSERLYEEGSSIEEFLYFLNGIDGEIILDLEGDGFSEELRKILWDFLDERIDLVRRTGWNMYHVFTRAV